MSDIIRVQIRPISTSEVIYTGSTVITGATNVGAGEGVYKDMSSMTLNFKSLIAGDNISISGGTDEIVINASLSGGSNYVTESTFTGYTATTETRLQGIESDITGNTAAIGENAADIVYLSGITSGNTANIANNATGITANYLLITGNTALINSVSAITESNYNLITGNTALINTLSGETINKLDSVQAGTLISIDNTDPKNPIVNYTGSTGGVSEATFTGYTASTETTLSGLRTDIDTVSGQTVSNATGITANYNLITGNTSLINTVSGLTVTNYDLITGNTAYIDSVSANTVSNATGITANYNSITGLTETKADKTLTVETLTGATSIDSTYNGKMIEANGTFTLTFTTGLPSGWNVSITNVGSGTITLAALGTLQTKDSATDIASQYGGVVAYSRGSNIILAAGDLS